LRFHGKIEQLIGAVELDLRRSEWTSQCPTTIRENKLDRPLSAAAS
jgi:hypothetical protein